MSLRWRRRLTGLLGMAVLAVVAALYVDFGVLVRALAQTDPASLALLILLAAVDRVWMAAKWLQLARAIGVSEPFAGFMRCTWAASLINQVAPGSLAGDLYRAVSLGTAADRHGVLASLVMEKLIGALAALALAWAGLFALGFSFDTGAAQPIFGALFAASCLAAGLLALALSPRTHAAAGRLARGRVAQRLERLSAATLLYRSAPVALAGNAALSLGENALQLALLALAARAVGIEAPTGQLLAVLAAAQFARRASHVLSGFGLQASVHVVLLALAGIDASLALALALLAHVVQLIACLPGAFALLRVERRGVQLREYFTLQP